MGFYNMPSPTNGTILIITSVVMEESERARSSMMRFPRSSSKQPSERGAEPAAVGLGVGPGVGGSSTTVGLGVGLGVGGSLIRVGLGVGPGVGGSSSTVGLGVGLGVGGSSISVPGRGRDGKGGRETSHSKRRDKYVLPGQDG